MIMSIFFILLPFVGSIRDSFLHCPRSVHMDRYSGTQGILRRTLGSLQVVRETFLFRRHSSGFLRLGVPDKRL